MAEYIKREAAIRAVKHYAKEAIDKGEKVLDTVDDTLNIVARIEKISTAADVVPVVRCKDCEWFMREHGCPIEASGYHKGGRSLPVENDFCSYGERRDGGADND